MNQGTIKWFNTIKGYGFITPKAGDDVFVHQSAIYGSGSTPVLEGQSVQFTVVEGLKGKKAIHVVTI